MNWKRRTVEYSLPVLRPSTGAAESAVRCLLNLFADNPFREGLEDTPARVVKALREMTQGYHEDPAEILSRTFEESSDEIVLLKQIQFTSLCEHHLLPFMGHAAVGYIPRKRVVGISKLARIVQCYARRFQIQERMTTQIAEAVETHLRARAVGVVIEATHQCMVCRGVRQSETRMVTSALLGGFRRNARARAEFFSLVKP